jgi:hypothetical protein
MIPIDLLELSRRNNRQSATCWDQFADHRARVMALLRETGGARLAVLGAGNCNDVDLPALAQAFREIHLVDIDEQALRRARAKQLPEVAASLVLHAPVELGGAVDQLAAFRESRPTLEDLQALPEACARRVSAALAPRFDTVVSVGHLSQLMVGCRLALGRENPDLKPISVALACGHARSLVRLLRPGGRGILVTDTCTSKLEPDLEELWLRRKPVEAWEQLERDGKVFLGTRPSALLDALESDPFVDRRADGPHRVAPWLWRMGPLVFLAYGITFRRRDDDDGG